MTVTLALLLGVISLCIAAIAFASGWFLGPFLALLLIALFSLARSTQS
jgi:hypothetical protein